MLTLICKIAVLWFYDIALFFSGLKTTILIDILDN